MLSKQAILDYKTIFQEEVGEELTYELANEKATKFLRLFKMIYQPVPKEYLKKIKERN